MADLRRRLLAESLGSTLLVATVVGSGIMAESLTADGALALLANAIPTGAILVVLITVLGPLSGAHFNPAVTLAFLTRRKIAAGEALAYVVVQITGAVLGAMLAHAMFGVPLQLGEQARTGPGLWLGEVVATFGLVTIILGGARARPDAVAWLVGLYIISAYWFTSSTSFANPAVTIARAFTNTFSGLRPVDAPAFIAAQLLGAGLAVVLHRLMWPRGQTP
ncbi:aquaporin [Devosia sp. A16]|uniref:aquaporin n=1 Tax=Devosia sp. A16 TaxID=1736675 RepID=UPI0006D7BEA2|nr:MIP/aquaporin family protein [Devosia sp. A16]